MNQPSFDESTLINMKLSVLLAGAFGALVSMWFQPQLSWRGAALSIISASALAYHTMPIIHEYLNLSTGLEGSVAFLVGLFGLLVTGKIYQFVANIDQKHIGAWLKALILKMLK
jgi:xanthosine utilization system XapX-like protein